MLQSHVQITRLSRLLKRDNAWAGEGLPQQALGISGRRALYLGERLLVEGCTSAAVRWEGAGGPYLLFITSDSVLHTVPLGRLQAGAALIADEPVAERCGICHQHSLIKTLPLSQQKT